jgi:hypothetical protein
MFIREELDRYLYWQVERENIRIQKEVSKLSPPWSNDSILQQYKFCQVFREEDRTTRWLKKHIREPMRNSADVLMAVVIFRWFNWIPTGRTLMNNNLLKSWDREKAIEEITKQDKWVTGAYIVKSPNGMDKVTGVAECISHMWERKNYIIDKLEEAIEQDKCSLEYCWNLLRDYPYMGPFMAYEVVTDLRFTYLLSASKDKLTWANAGPGAMRGLNRLTGRQLDFCQRSHDWCSEMVALYDIALEKLPVTITFRNDLPYELREIEGGLCEFDKYSRIYKGEGRTRSIYKYNEKLPLVEGI